MTLDRAEALRVADLCVETRGDARAVYEGGLVALLRDGLGYTMPTGETVPSWRTAYRAWTALARGLPAPRAGRPRRDPSEVRLSLSPEARAVLERADDPSTLVERLLLSERGE